MSMSTEQALEYMHSADNVAETKEPSTEVSKSEEVNVNSPDESATPNDGTPVVEETKGSDEPKVEQEQVEQVEDNKKEEVKKEEVKNEDVKKEDKPSHKEQRDYAFIRKSQQLKEAKARIKELEETLNKYKGLSSKDFKDKDGNADIDAYTNWKLQERDMQNEVKKLQNDQLQAEIEEDRIVTERCFQGKELEEYDNLIKTKGQAFAEAIKAADENNVVFKYLDTVRDYPIVIRELMTNPNKWLGRIFRSRDDYSLKKNTSIVVDEILDEYESSKNVKVETTPKQEVAATEPKPAIPVIGKQISTAGATNQDTSGSLLTSINSINNYLRKHKRY